MEKKHILITGANSYVGTSFEKWLSQWPDKYHVDTIDMTNDAWREKSFAEYDVVFHVAGIAHRKETKENAHEYYEINRDIAVDTAKKAKADGVSQFIFMSTMGVYGLLTGVITKETIPAPKTHYGKSKLQAEEQIQKLSSDSFKVVILRPPMIYGKGCKGNYQKLAKLARITPIFPDIENKRSMIYIDNFSEFVREIIDDNSKGTFCPQNAEYVCISAMVKEIANTHDKKVCLETIFSRVIKNFIGRQESIAKAFGDLYYDMEQDRCGTIDFTKSVLLTERETPYRATKITKAAAR